MSRQSPLKHAAVGRQWCITKCAALALIGRMHISALAAAAAVTRRALHTVPAGTGRCGGDEIIYNYFYLQGFILQMYYVTVVNCDVQTILLMSGVC